MKAINVTIPNAIKRALETRYNVAKLQSALDAEYNNDGRKQDDIERLAVNTTEAGISSAKAKEGKTEGAKGEFKSVDVHKVERTGILNDPRRMIAWLVAFAKFTKVNGEPSGEITPDIMPAGLVFWLERKFLKPEIEAAQTEAAKAKAKASGKAGVRNGNIDHVPAE